MKNLLKIVLTIFIFFILNTKSYASKIGIFEVYDKSEFVMSYNYSYSQVENVTKGKVENISPKEYSVLIFNKYSQVDNNVYRAICAYLKAGGKIILITPSNLSDEQNFKKLAKLIGVNVEKIYKTNVEKDVNWVEKTFSNNILKSGAIIADVSLDSETSHLAVFGDIEKHESAISKNYNGYLFSWNWGSSGNKDFNEKSMKAITDNLVPKQQISSYNAQNILPLESYTHHQALSDVSEKINALRNDREYISNYQDNIINYSKEMSGFQQKLELSKINEIYALYYAKNNNLSEYNKYLELANQNILDGTIGTNNLSPAKTQGIWFDRGTIVKIKNKAEMGRYFEKLKNSGINIVYFETINAGYTIYPSKIGTQNPLTLGKDPLAWAIDEAHSRKMKLQAWIWVFAVGNDRHNSIISKQLSYPGPILEKNQKWALLGEYGNIQPKKQPEFWIDPSNKEATNYIMRLINEITSTYNIDGIQLDYIRYPFQAENNLMGFNHNSTEQYTCSTGEKIFNNNYSSNFMWNKWKENNINNFVKNVSREIKSKKTTMKVSAAIFSKTPDFRLNAIQQNYENWIENSYVDFLTPMSYSSTISALNANINPLKSQFDKGLIYPGIALQHVNQIELLKQTSVIYENGFPGISLFAVAQLDEPKTKLLTNIFSNKENSDVSYNKINSAKLLLDDYKTSVCTIKSIQYDLSQQQKIELENLISEVNNVIQKIQNKQLQNALILLKELERRNDNFFRTYSTNNSMRKQTLTGYLKRAESLINITQRRN